jgi:hypothetical protein
VGAHENSDSPYGTFDQGGNVWEWNESVGCACARRGSTMRLRGLRGGSVGDDDESLHASCRNLDIFPRTSPPVSGFVSPRFLSPLRFVVLALLSAGFLRRKRR